ncbi:MAG: ComF family protein [Methyloprofundus sp.]|nr:ComF family protein [Methyloprofundus sp.]
MSIELQGNWEKGVAYDVHTLASNYLGVDEHGHDRWDSVRSDMGELVYQLKYRGDLSKVPEIVDLIVTKFKGLDSLDVVIPAPASKTRSVQPVAEIAKALAEKVGIDYLDALSKSSSQELKGMDALEDRLNLLRDSMSIKPGMNLMGKNVLIVDDLFRSGATLQVATEILYRDAKCHNVYVLTMTKTRSKR